MISSEAFFSLSKFVFTNLWNLENQRWNEISWGIQNILFLAMVETYGWKRIFLKNLQPSEDAPITDQTLKNEKCNTNTEESNYFWGIRPDIGLWDYFQNEVKRKERTLQPNFDGLHNQSSSLAHVFKVSILPGAAGTCVSRESA